MQIRWHIVTKQHLTRKLLRMKMSFRHLNDLVRHRSQSGCWLQLQLNYPYFLWLTIIKSCQRNESFSIHPFYFQRIVFWRIRLFRQKGYLVDVSVGHTYIISIHVARITYDGVWKTYINQNVIGINHVIDYIIHIFMNIY